jgi:uncharacterized protein (TIGR02246 family)
LGSFDEGIGKKSFGYRLFPYDPATTRFAAAPPLRSSWHTHGDVEAFMYGRWRSVLWSLLFLVYGACAHSESTVRGRREAEPSFRAAIQAQHEAWRAAVMAGDASALASLFVEDGVLLGFGGSLLQGRTKIEEGVRGALQKARYLGGGFTIEALDLQGNLAIEVVAFEWDRSLEGGPPTGLQKGHALAVWQRTADGRWLLRAWSPKWDPKS